MSDIEQTLAERGERYGAFPARAAVAQAIKAAIATGPNWPALAPDQREALDMIAHKISRIVAGDPDYHDSWHDIAGYATLVADRLLQAAPVLDLGEADSPLAALARAAAGEPSVLPADWPGRV